MQDYYEIDTPMDVAFREDKEILLQETFIFLRVCDTNAT